MDEITGECIVRISDIKPFPTWVGNRNQLIVKVETDEGIYGLGEVGIRYWGEALNMGAWPFIAVDMVKVLLASGLGFALSTRQPFSNETDGS